MVDIGMTNHFLIGLRSRLHRRCFVTGIINKVKAYDMENHRPYWVSYCYLLGGHRVKPHSKYLFLFTWISAAHSFDQRSSHL